MSSGEPTGAELEARLQHGYALDHLWRETMGLPPGDTKEKPLRLVTDLLERGGVAYALIGGVALQLHTQEPRTTRDIDLAIRAYIDVPRAALLDAGFEHTGRHQHSDNWLAPAAEPALRTVVQFSAEEPRFVGAVDRATLVDIGDLRLRLATAPDLIVLKLAAAEDPNRRQSKRQHDLGDILTLLEEQPQLHVAVPDLSERLEAIQRRLQAGRWNAKLRLCERLTRRARSHDLVVVPALGRHRNRGTTCVPSFQSEHSRGHRTVRTFAP